ncbi:hypothetical protein Pse7367_0605 [Thalassoporum mexicanum PCC 7367]|uniref:hypothetical protein n=1 Tax=Thalassoporum mexicanum TaxID=3457544 RepID=UPI00029FB0FC|nr:hypothetical protein [Pseudanabaena sp. PCC 7367]AFY68909.1 hypothetical protein Pse7367_0605 [Pseudanabaena sp. PCC 7367]
MEPTKYPGIVNRLRQKILKLDQLIHQISEAVIAAMADIDRQVAKDPKLRNEAQRSRRRAQLMNSDRGYLDAVGDLRRALKAQAELEMELDVVISQLETDQGQVA